jgi:hypothetical protein
MRGETWRLACLRLPEIIPAAPQGAACPCHCPAVESRAHPLTGCCCSYYLPTGNRPNATNNNTGWDSHTDGFWAGPSLRHQTIGFAHWARELPMRYAGSWKRLGHRVAPLCALAVLGGLVAPTAPAAGARPGTARLGFYGDIGAAFVGHIPPLVRPSTIRLTEDGSVALVHLQWNGWGTRVAHAIGVWSASNCTPSCAAGKRTTSPARLTLWNPGRVGVHRVYRSFQIAPPHPQRDIADRACIRRQGAVYAYAPILTR